MAHSILRKPPARFVAYPRNEGQTQRIKGGGGQLFDASKRYGSAALGSQRPELPSFVYRWLDTIQINAAPEQPRLVFNSAAQPIIRWGYRRMVRTLMAAAPRFYGRWFYAGTQVNQFVARGRMTGVTTRQGTTYLAPRFQTGPRAIPLGARRR
jgi:hypothetical protein